MLNLKPSLLLTYLIARFLALGRHRPPCPSLFSATLTQSAIPLARSGGRTPQHVPLALPFPLCSVPLFPLDAMLHPEKIERRTNGHRTFIAHSLVPPSLPPSARPSRPSPHHLAPLSSRPSIAAAATTTSRPRSPFLIVSAAGSRRLLSARFPENALQNCAESRLFDFVTLSSVT